MLKRMIIAVLLCCHWGLPAQGDTLTEAQPQVLGEVGVELTPPEGFEPATAFAGFQQQETGASILVTALPAPFHKLVPGLTAANLEQRGMELLSQEVLEKDAKLLLHIAQDARGQRFLKWILVLSASENQTRLITATFPEAAAASLSQPLKQAVLSTMAVAVDPTQGDFPFQITPSPQLQEVEQARGLGKTLAYSKNGMLPLGSGTNPFFIVGPSLGAVPVGDRQTYAIKRLQQFNDFDDLQVGTVRAIAIDQLQGYEILATATDQETQTPLQLYQVMLFPEAGGYILLFGMVDQGAAAQYLPEFKAMAQSFKLKP